MFFYGEVRHCGMKKQIWSGETSPQHGSWTNQQPLTARLTGGNAEILNYTFSVNLLPAICDKAWEW